MACRRPRLCESEKALVDETTKQTQGSVLRHPTPFRFRPVAELSTLVMEEVDGSYALRLMKGEPLRQELEMASVELAAEEDGAWNRGVVGRILASGRCRQHETRQPKAEHHRHLSLRSQ